MEGVQAWVLAWACMCVIVGVREGGCVFVSKHVW